MGENDIINTSETAGNAGNATPNLGDLINCPGRNPEFLRVEALKVKKRRGGGLLLFQVYQQCFRISGFRRVHDIGGALSVSLHLKNQTFMG